VTLVGLLHQLGVSNLAGKPLAVTGRNVAVEGPLEKDDGNFNLLNSESPR
jgi:hypothetical protein